MPTGSRIFWLPRRGNSPAEYEDACAANDAAGRYAVADGASEGCFTDLWARLLVKDFVDRADCPAGEWPVSLSEAQGQWDTDVRSQEIAWHAEPWVQQGACAAFLGISLTALPRDGARFLPWQAVAMGDTCLFHTRDGAMLRAFPLEHSEQFNNAPKLVGARMSLEQIHKKRSSWTDGQGRPGDRLWAMTDALAQWCLAEAEAGGNPWAELELLLAELGRRRPFHTLDRRAPPVGAAPQRRRYLAGDTFVRTATMAWPTPTDYAEAVQRPRASLEDEELRGGEVARTPLGLPMLWSGNFADVYKIHCPATGNTWALKCFTRQVPGQQERYRAIAAHLEQAQAPVHRRFPVPGARHPHQRRAVSGAQDALGGRADAQPVRRGARGAAPESQNALGPLGEAGGAAPRGGIAHADLQHGNVLLVPDERRFAGPAADRLRRHVRAGPGGDPLRRSRASGLSAPAAHPRGHLQRRGGPLLAPGDLHRHPLPDGGP